MSRETRRDLLLGLAFGLIGLTLFHLDHLVEGYRAAGGWTSGDWLLHLVVDGSYVLVYGGLGWVMARGWRLWRRRNQ